MGVEIAISIAREETRVAVLDNGVVTDLGQSQAPAGQTYTGRRRRHANHPLSLIHI